MKRTNVVRMTVLVLLTLMLHTAVTAQSSPIQLILKAVDADVTPTVDDQSYPNLRMELVPISAVGVPIVGLTSADVSLFDGDVPLEDVTVSPVVDVDQDISIMVVLDVSGPMQPILDDVKTAVPILYEALEQTDESAIITFDSRMDGTTVNIEALTTLDTARALSFTSDEGALRNLINRRQIEFGSGTPLYDALFKGVRMTATQATNERSAVIVITNGADRAGDEGTTGSLLGDDAFLLEDAREFAIPIFTIGIGNQTDERFLQRAAIVTGGELTILRDADDLGQRLVDIAFQLKQAYRVTATAVTLPDNETHPLTISVNAGGVVQETHAFHAYYPLIPKFDAVHLVTTNEKINLSQVRSSGGILTIEPELMARGEITAVNYYLDDQDEALFTADAPPWTFEWDSTTVPPNQSYRLTIEAIDADQNAGYYETTLKINACNFLCQMGVSQRAVPLMVAILLGLALIVLITILISRMRKRTQPEAAMPTPDNLPFAKAYESFPERPAEPVYLPPVSDTPIFHNNPTPSARLVDEASNAEYALSYDLRIGRDTGTDITLSGEDVANHHAIVKRENEQFVLVINGRHNQPTSINGTSAESKRIPLNDGDIIHIGEHRLRFVL
ncbi:MAG: FHA domain-containing protein [Chloroflexi bacterium]|nr:FHA domain-containing protein [Chloroflexota bacterium]